MYKQLYKEIINFAKAECRKKKCGIYYESHHIVPDFMFKHRTRKGPAGHLDGNPKSIDNLVLLTFREHLLCHYYLYEIYKDTRYGYATGSALQFFFVKATSKHQRQVTLSAVDEKFLIEMEFARKIGIQSISNARKGKMSVVDAITKERIGAVKVNHPMVISGKWVHHSTGKKSPLSGRNQKGTSNANYRKISDNMRSDIFDCVSLALVDGNHLIKRLLLIQLKAKFIQFKKISYVWIKNHIGSPADLVTAYNLQRTNPIQYNPYYRSTSQRDLLAIATPHSHYLKANTL